MQNYVTRMIQEKEDLQGKIKRAKKVIENIPFGMDKTQIMLLGKQIKIMEEYLDCLSERLVYEENK